MKDFRRARRVGLTAILCALLMRLWAAGVPEKVAAWLTEPNTAAFLIYLETGRDVRFSSSSEVFSPDFVESPPPAIPEPTEAPIPSFSDAQSIEIYYAADKNPDIEGLLSEPLEWDLYGDAPTVLILHTHSTESYTQDGENYVETSDWRTLDENYNMLSIGHRVGEILAENGITAIQDRELHDYPSYNGSYTDARKSIKAYLEEYPTIQLILDLHRDASGGDGGQMRTKATVNGQDSAQLMVVMGVNHENFEKNLSFSLKLHAQLENQAPGIMRPLQLRAARFNQDLCTGAVLIEVGAAGNTHKEAMLAAEELGKAIVALARGTQ
ncbi:MAG: stage II sporulation protein P [Oscillospiraceae bacterium]|nr:stage II sporulation protein P [Oscillospiraceae bacterium]